MEVVVRRIANSQRIAILPAAFNPPTIAHLALARAALAHVDEVLFVLPRLFPHKEMDVTTLRQRVEMVQASIQDEERFSLAISEGGLFIEIARETRLALGDSHLSFLCGRDAAERIVSWDYGAPSAFSEMLREFSLLVAARQGKYEVPHQFDQYIRCLTMNALDEVSSTEVRRRIGAGEDWQSLVPAAIRNAVEAAYR